MTPCAGPKLPFSDHGCSRDGEVALGIGSCHPSEFSVIASGVHHLLGCRLQQLLCFIGRFLDVFVNTFVSELTSCWRFEFLHIREHPFDHTNFPSDNFLS